MLQRDQLGHTHRQLTVEALAQYLEQQHPQNESRLVELRADCADAIANNKQNSIVLHNHLLQTRQVAAPALSG